MSDAKRVSFSNISMSTAGPSAAGGSAAFMAATTSSAANMRFGTDFAAGQNKPSVAATERKVNTKSTRLNFELFATDSCKYPEFNYSKLLHLEKKKLKKLKQKSNGCSDPFEENDDDVARIAKELEEKYGTSYARGRGRSKKDDHCDIGLGYDESDSFIDNTEAYDEVIPEEVETLEGGFYINSGALEFKKLRSESTTTKTDEIIKMPNRPKKRVLSSSSEDSSSSDDDEDNSDEAAEVETDGKASSSSGPAVKRTKTAATTNAPTNKKPSAKNDTNKKKEKAVGLSFSSSNSPKPGVDELGTDSEKERSRQKTVKTTTVKDMLKAKRDSFLKMQEGGETKTQNGELKGTVTKSSEDGSSDDDSDGSENSDSNQPVESKQKKPEESSEKLRSCDTKLPELDADVVANIQEFKEIVKSKNMSGKKFLFDDKLTELFLKIDEDCLCIEKPQRNMVFAHLEYYLSLPKYYFLRKAKQLRIKEEKLKSKRALTRLRNAIIEVMPGAIDHFELELQANNLNSDNPPKMPKKKFPWNDNMRNLLFDVYQVRWTSYPVLGTRKESLEDFINTYMKGKVVQLWPAGWMRYEDLHREIEKRKLAAKKAKEKKKDNASSNLTAAATAVASTKQFEDLSAAENRSRGTSDTDSVASSAPSAGTLKRKNAEQKQTKSKSQKNKNEPDKHLNENNNESTKKSASKTIIVDISSPSKRTDHSIHSIISTNASLTASALTQQLQQKHSGKAASGLPAAHIINLDNYKSASDILMTSKQLLGNSSSNATIVKTEGVRGGSSSESDGVEIVGVFPAKPAAAFTKGKIKKNAGSNQSSRSATPTYSGMHMEATNMSMKPFPAYSLNNNNITKGNKKTSTITSNMKNSTDNCVNSSDFDASKVVKVLKELKELQQHPKKAHTMSPSNASVKELSNQ